MAILARDTEKSDVEVDAHFSVGRDYLLRVVNRLRPGYGFALYELGILHRVWGKWDEAYQFQQKALQVPEKYRDTKDERVKEELERISNKDNSYP